MILKCSSWLGLLSIAALLAGCNAQLPDPVAATTAPSAVALVAAAPPAAVGAPFTVVVGQTGSVPTFTDTRWNSFVIVRMDSAQMNPARPTSVTLACNDGTATQTLAGFSSGSWPVSCGFLTAGTYPVTATATAADGFSSSDTFAVTAIARPAAPVVEVPPPVVLPPSLNIALTCTPQRAKATTSCNVSVSYQGKSVTASLSKVRWEFGDGMHDATLGPLVSHEYSQAGTFRLLAHVSYQDLEGDALTTLVIPN